MTAIPSVQYVRNGEFTLAYQVTGSGSKDLVYLLFETPNVVGNWFDPLHASFMERLASFSRLVITDRRGMGCSDRLPPGQSPTLEDLVDDLLVIIEAAYATPATVLPVPKPHSSRCSRPRPIRTASRHSSCGVRRQAGAAPTTFPGRVQTIRSSPSSA